MNDPEQDARRRRLRELLAIPDRERSDAQWDELNELEIMMAVTNRQAVPRPDQGGQGGRRHDGQPHGGGRKFHNRPPRRRPPPGR